jgi:guanine nucleotide-binding protein subunit beta-2-like 1 protein
MAASDHMILRSTLSAHGDWVTAIAAPVHTEAGEAADDIFVSTSRDGTGLVWRVTGDAITYAVPERSLEGHSHFVQDVCLSADAKYALTASWDHTMRLWDLESGKSVYTFTGHTKDVLSVCFNPENTKILSGSRDRSIRLWNVLAKEMACIDGPSKHGHTDWVSCVRFSPNPDANLAVSAGWDKVVKVWAGVSEHEYRLQCNLVGHLGYLNTATVSPDGSLCASGGKDGDAMLWEVNEGRNLYTLPAGSTINTLAFSPTRYWLVAATNKNITIWDLERKAVVATLEVDFEDLGERALRPYCTSLCWNAEGTVLYSGYTDNKIRVWQVGAM